MVIFTNFSPTSSHLHPLQVENCGSNSRLVVDEDDYRKFRLERVNPACIHVQAYVISLSHLSCLSVHNVNSYPILYTSTKQFVVFFLQILFKADESLTCNCCTVVQFVKIPTYRTCTQMVDGSENVLIQALKWFIALLVEMIRLFYQPCRYTGMTVI